MTKILKLFLKRLGFDGHQKKPEANWTNIGNIIIVIPNKTWRLGREPWLIASSLELITTKSWVNDHNLLALVMKLLNAGKVKDLTDSRLE